MQNPLKPELMSPAGYWPELQTAIESGADAVYFGLNHFTARAKVGFSLEELPEVFQTCLLYTSPSPRDATLSRMPSSA